MRGFVAGLVLLASCVFPETAHARNLPISPTATAALRAFLVEAITNSGEIPASCHLTKGHMAYVCLTLDRAKTHVSGVVVVTRPGFCRYKAVPWVYDHRTHHAYATLPVWMHVCL